MPGKKVFRVWYKKAEQKQDFTKQIRKCVSDYNDDYGCVRLPKLAERDVAAWRSEKDTCRFQVFGHIIASLESKRQIDNTYQRRERYGTLLPLIVICQVLLSALVLF